MKTEEQIEKGKEISGIIAFWCFVGFFLCEILAIILDKIK